MNDVKNVNTTANNTTLSPERREQIETIVNEYFDKIKENKSSDFFTDLLKVLDMLEKTSAKADFLSAYFSEVGTLIEQTDSYEEKVELYIHSSLVKSFVGEKSSSSRQQILLYFKEVITNKAFKALSEAKASNSNLVETYRLMQLAYLSSNPVKQFSSEYQGLSTYTSFIVDTYLVDTSNEDFLTKLARFDKYFNKSK